MGYKTSPKFKISMWKRLYQLGEIRKLEFYSAGLRRVLNFRLELLRKRTEQNALVLSLPMVAPDGATAVLSGCGRGWFRLALHLNFDVRGDLAMKFYGHVMFAQSFERIFELNFAPVDFITLHCQSFRNVHCRDGSKEGSLFA